MTPEQQTQKLIELTQAQNAILMTIAKQLERMAQANAPASPNYRRKLSEYPGFDFATIGATVEAQDQHGPTELEWNSHRWTRRRSKGEDDSFGEAIWYSRPAGGSEKTYYILIKFADYQAKKIGSDLAESVQSKAEQQPARPKLVKPQADVIKPLDIYAPAPKVPNDPATFDPHQQKKLDRQDAKAAAIAAPIQGDPRATFYQIGGQAAEKKIISFDVFNSLVSRASKEGFEAALAGLREVLTKAGAVELLTA